MPEMTIDLEQFLDKEVILTLSNDMKVETKIGCTNDSTYSYWCIVNGMLRTYTKNGIYDTNYDNEFNIKSIQLKNQPMIKLSNQAFQKLTESIISEVIDYIMQDERYVDFMQEVIPDAISYLMGELDENLKYELSIAIMDHITMRSVK